MEIMKKEAKPSRRKKTRIAQTVWMNFGIRVLIISNVWEECGKHVIWSFYIPCFEAKPFSLKKKRQRN